MSREEMFAVIRANAQLVLEGAKNKDIQETNSLRDFGADSLESVEVISRSMKQLNLKIPRADLSKLNNIKDLLDLFEKLGSPGSNENR
jgi:acyl carrier protein